jgi:hypothetical protein
MARPWQESDLRKRSDIAKLQLAEWQERASHWAVIPVYRDHRHMIVCAQCEQSLWFIKDQYEDEFTYNDDEKLLLIVAHIRQRHPEVNNAGL